MVSQKSTTKTTTRADTPLKYGYMFVESEETYKDAAGNTRITKTRKIARDPDVGFFRKLLRL